MDKVAHTLANGLSLACLERPGGEIPLVLLHGITALEDGLAGSLQWETDEVLGTDYGRVLLDDPDDRRIRGLMSKAFTPRSVEAMRERLEAITAELL